MAKSRKMARKSHKRHSKKHTRRMRNKRRGGGYTDMPSKFINPGNVVHQQYSGPGMDCAGSATRPGYLGSNSFAGTGGLPGLNGKLFGGATQLGSGGIVAGAAIAEAFAAQQGFRGSTTGAAAELKQMGGRYGFDGAAGILNPQNGIVAMGPGAFGRLPCETGTTDKLNLNPNGIQTMSTAPPYTPGWSHYIKGGKRKTRKTGGAQLSPAPLTVTVGAVDAMRYNAPTAGYSNWPLAPQVPNNPGILMQTPYDAKAFNMACLKTGGGKRKVGGEGGIVFGPAGSPVHLPEAPVGKKGLILPKKSNAMNIKKSEEVSNIVMEGSEAAAEVVEKGLKLPKKANAMNIEQTSAALVNASGAAEVVAENIEMEGQEGGAYPVAAMAGNFIPVTMADYKGGILPVKFGGKRRKTRRGGAFAAFNPSQLPMTPGMPVAAQAGNFPNFQRIPVGHYIAGSSVNTGPVSRPAAGGARKNRKNRKDKK